MNHETAIGAKYNSMIRDSEINITWLWIHKNPFCEATDGIMRWNGHLTCRKFQNSEKFRPCQPAWTAQADITRYNSADSVPTSNLVCMKEVAIRTTFCIAGIIYYTCDLVIASRCNRYKQAINKPFSQILCQNNSAKIYSGMKSNSM